MKKLSLLVLAATILSGSALANTELAEKIKLIHFTINGFKLTEERKSSKLFYCDTYPKTNTALFNQSVNRLLQEEGFSDQLSAKEIYKFVHKTQRVKAIEVNTNLVHFIDRCHSVDELREFIDSFQK